MHQATGPAARNAACVTFATGCQGWGTTDEGQRRAGKKIRRRCWAVSVSMMVECDSTPVVRKRVSVPRTATTIVRPSLLSAMSCGGAKAFNLFGRTNLAAPDGYLGFGGFGRISSTETNPRQIQLGVKLSF